MVRERVLPAVYIGISVLIVILLSVYGILVFRLPSYNGSLKTKHVTAEVQIHRDRSGMPHIIASSDEDAYFGLGYAMAQDRLFQMDLLRRAATGRLAEVLGPELLKTDILFRTITAPIPATKIYAEMPREVRDAVLAFSNGVNLAMERESRPVEFLLLGYSPEPWKPEDSLSALYIMSWDLSPAFSQEILFHIIQQRLGPVSAGILFSEYVDRGPDILTGMQASAYRPDNELFARDDPAPGLREVELLEAELTESQISHTQESLPGISHPMATHAQESHAQVSRTSTGNVWEKLWAAAVPGDKRNATTPGAKTEKDEVLETRLRYALRAHQLFESIAGSPGAGASNNWVISPDKSATGTAVVANDMHLGHGIPGIWYQAHLISPDLNVTGVMLPGVPFVVAGGNEHTARGFTNVMLDDIDFYREKLDPDNPDRVMYRNRYVDIETIKTTIQVKGEDPVEHTIRITPHGPIITDIHPLLRKEADHLDASSIRESLQGEAISIRWTLYDHTDAALGLYRANRARSIKDIEKALENFKIPAQNWVYADSEGNIGYTAAAGIPVRQGFSGQGLLRGWDGSQEWNGYVPTARQPSVRNPKEGWIASANNRHSANFPYTISNYYASPDRYQRIQQLLNTTDGLDRKDHQRLQMDVFNFQARNLMPYFRQALDLPFPQTDDRWTDQNLEKARNLLLDWNLQNDRSSSGAVVYHYFLITLVKNIFEPVIGSDLFPYYASNRYTMFNTLQNILRSPEHPFYEKGKLSRNEIIRKSFEQAIRTLLNKHSTATEVRWADIHSLEYKHPFGRDSALLGYFFNRGPFPIDGSWSTVAPAGFKIQDLDSAEFAVTHGASQRMIYDVGNPDASVTALPGGISGQFLSPHYDDQIQDYIEGGYRASPFREEEARKLSKYLLVLQPADSND